MSINKTEILILLEHIFKYIHTVTKKHNTIIYSYYCKIYSFGVNITHIKAIKLHTIYRLIYKTLDISQMCCFALDYGLVSPQFKTCSVK